MTTKKPSYLPERTAYGLDITLRTGLGSLAGYGIKQGLSLAGYVLDQFHNVLIPKAAAADQAIGKVIVEHGGNVGEALVNVDKVHGDIWSKIFGRTPEAQKQWRKEHGLEEAKYLEPQTTVTIEATPRPTLQPTHYQEQFSSYGDHLTSLGLLAGLTWGALRGRGKYRDAVHRKKVISLQEEHIRQTEALNARVSALETRIALRLEERAGDSQ